MYVVHVRRIPIRSTCTTYMCDSVNIHRTCTAYMYGVHVMYDSVNTALRQSVTQQQNPIYQLENGQYRELKEQKNR